ncbi:hypothetical protein QE152_g19409 [Popillia japonica]|uniref:Uncharacterized protein n=1 Tax=Popillia japonica TaxID=7064 RepID=A0AAW1KQU3_POPJA
MEEYHHLYQELKGYPDHFYEYLRMEPSTFQYILNKIENKVNKRWENCHKIPISVEESLVITLRLRCFSDTGFLLAERIVKFILVSSITAMSDHSDYTPCSDVHPHI